MGYLFLLVGVAFEIAAGYEASTDARWRTILKVVLGFLLIALGMDRV